MTQLIAFTDRAPALVVAAGERASYRFFEFFTAQIGAEPHIRPVSAGFMHASDARKYEGD